MPKVLTVGQYILFFWSHENGEPVHIHVAVKRACENATKFWLTANGGFLLANNNSAIPDKDLRFIAKVVRLNHRYICKKWAETFGEDSLSFYE